MTIPARHLLALTELFSGNPDQESRRPFFQCNGYKIDPDGWSCSIVDTAGEAWYFRPFGLNHSDLKTRSGELETAPSQWTIDERLTNELRKTVGEKSTTPFVSDLLGNLFIIASDSTGNVLAARCANLQLVANALHSWGNPPESVIRDWQNQLRSLPKSSACPSTAETLVTEDGTLLPLSDPVNQLLASCHKGGQASKKQSSNSGPFSSPAPDWPKWVAECAIPPDANSDGSSINHVKLKTPTKIELGSTKKSAIEWQFNLAPTAQRKSQNKNLGAYPGSKKKTSKLLPIGLVVAILTILASAFWFLKPEGRPHAGDLAKAELPSSPSTLGSDKNKTLAARSTESEANMDVESIESETLDLVISRDPSAMFADAASQQTELTVESLLSQLRPNQKSPINLSSITASAIISQALAPSVTESSGNSSDAAMVADNELGETPDRADLDSVVSDRGIITLERPLKLQAAKIKETVVVGTLVVAKACRCEIELKLRSDDKLVVEPLEAVTIEGIGKALWKIAIEDEEPELFVEITSKPSARWQIVSSVWLRETRGALPILIGPRDAQNVGNRLIDYRQWINASIESLRTARSNSRGRSNIDFTGEIKKLERQEREAESAIDRWKMIARLSHYFFDGNEIRIQFTAIEKP